MLFQILYSRKMLTEPANIGLPCQTQVAVFKEMSAAPRTTYVSDNGRLTTNSFHGLALFFHDKQTDLGHTHYMCKTNMAICHKVKIKNFDSMFTCFNVIRKHSASEDKGGHAS